MVQLAGRRLLVLVLLEELGLRLVLGMMAHLVLVDLDQVLAKPLDLG
jgi:hypothetical protein